MANGSPAFCRLLTRPLQWLPAHLTSGGLALALNHLLADALASGEIAFLDGKVVAIEVGDLGIGLRLTLRGGVFARPPAHVGADVVFRGNAHAYLLLATQHEDADALFFRRLLRIEGDTATGLHLKNFLDALGDSPLPTPARRALEGLLDQYERHCVDESSAKADSGPVSPVG